MLLTYRLALHQCDICAQIIYYHSHQHSSFGKAENSVMELRRSGLYDVHWMTARLSVWAPNNTIFVNVSNIVHYYYVIRNVFRESSISHSVHSNERHSHAAIAHILFVSQCLLHIAQHYFCLQIHYCVYRMSHVYRGLITDAFNFIVFRIWAMGAFLFILLCRYYVSSLAVISQLCGSTL